MSLKSIKSNYIKFLQVLKDTGVTINESQKEILDNFVTEIETTLNKTRDDAIRTTKKLVEEKLEKDFKVVVESIIEHKNEHDKIAGEIQNKITEINESKDINYAVNKYLSKYIEEILPEKTIVDYERMEKLEKIHESLKDIFEINESEISLKKDEKTSQLVKENQELKKKIEETEKKAQCCEKELEQSKVKEFISDKTKDLPIAEKEKVCDKTKEMNLKDLEENFQKILEDCKDEIESEKNSEDEINLEEAMKNILENEDVASDKETSSKDVDSMENDTIVTEMDNIENDTEDDEETSDSVQINESIMQSWIEAINRTTPKK